MKRYRKNNKKINSIVLLLLVPFIPLIVAYKNVIYNQSVIETNTLYGQGYIDFFSYGKMIFLVTIAILMILSFIINNYKKKINITNTEYIYYIPIAVFVFGAIISTLFATNKYVGMMGYYGRFEGLLVLLSYSIILFYSIYYMNEEKQFVLISKFIALGAFIVALIGSLQYFGYDFIKSDIGLFFIGALNKVEITKTFDTI